MLRHLPIRQSEIMTESQSFRRLRGYVNIKCRRYSLLADDIIASTLEESMPRVNAEATKVLHLEPAEEELHILKARVERSCILELIDDLGYALGKGVICKQEQEEKDAAEGAAHDAD